MPIPSTQVKGFTEVMKEKEGDSVGVDLVVHSTCKLLGHLGSHPEYGRGVQAFPEHLKAVLEKAREVGDTEEEELERLRASLDVKLARQVGSRYFVTSRNAGRLLSCSIRCQLHLFFRADKGTEQPREGCADLHETPSGFSHAKSRWSIFRPNLRRHDDTNEVEEVGQEISRHECAHKGAARLPHHTFKHPKIVPGPEQKGVYF